MRKRILIFGTGKSANTILKEFSFLENNFYIVAFVDNNTQKQGSTFNGIPIIAPNEISNQKYDDIIVASTFFNEIVHQLKNEYKISPHKIYNQYYFVRYIILKYYNELNNIKKLEEEQKEVIRYIYEHQNLNSFNRPFVEKYCSLEVKTYFDEAVGMYFVKKNNKRMYFSRRFKDESAVKTYYRSIEMEQDDESPHKYEVEKFHVNFGDIVIDAGVAEGNFALSIIDKVSKIYLIEEDKEWIEALRITFEPYKDKVVFVHKYLSNTIENNRTTLEELLHFEKVDFIKMDIEGEEYKALLGAKKVILQNPKIKLDICVYHKEDDEKVISMLLKDYGMKVDRSRGYLFFIYGEEAWNYKIPVKMRRGLIRAYFD